jgi:hypothetical protein
LGWFSRVGFGQAPVHCPRLSVPSKESLRVISRPDARNTRFYSKKICYLWSFFDTAIGISASTSHSLIPARVDLDLFLWKIFIFQRQLRIKLMNFYNAPIKVKGLFFELWDVIILPTSISTPTLMLSIGMQRYVISHENSSLI